MRGAGVLDENLDALAVRAQMQGRDGAGVPERVGDQLGHQEQQVLDGPCGGRGAEQGDEGSDEIAGVRCGIRLADTLGRM
ncbi:hypothetical protein Sliba_03640 [Streptomyces nigrescens]|uniref:Uncharacterized protein n=1 Tax=Streptomyces nigrescens TaxID=1920 RepID=A0A640TBR5_STRNI|nr:hypothetical protein Sliba_03640 [Streptomyces libani subsp. libani]